MYAINGTIQLVKIKRRNTIFALIDRLLVNIPIRIPDPKITV